MEPFSSPVIARTENQKPGTIQGDGPKKVTCKIAWLPTKREHICGPRGTQCLNHIQNGYANSILISSWLWFVGFTFNFSFRHWSNFWEISRCQLANDLRPARRGFLMAFGCVLLTTNLIKLYVSWTLREGQLLDFWCILVWNKHWMLKSWLVNTKRWVQGVWDFDTEPGMYRYPFGFRTCFSSFKPFLAIEQHSGLFSGWISKLLDAMMQLTKPPDWAATW